MNPGMKKFCFLFFFLWGSSLLPLSADDYIQISQPPGTYDTDIPLAIETPEPDITLFYRFILDNSTYTNGEEVGPWIHVSGPVMLSAVQGEEVCYQLDLRGYRENEIIEERQLRYVIDKKRPSPPILNLPGGEYADDLSLMFFFKDKSCDKGNIFYSVNSLVLEKGRVWDGKSIDFPGKYGRKKEYTIQAYTLDAAGNRSDVMTSRYIINMTKEAGEPPIMEVKSPVPGTFANKQLLYIEFYNCTWIKYTIDGKDPGENGHLYTGPVLLDATGPVTLKVTAMPRLTDSFPLVKEISYTVVPDRSQEITVNPESGIYYSDIKAVLSAGSRNLFNYTLKEYSPTEKDQITRAEILLEGKEDESVCYPLRVRTISPGVKLGKEYRFFYCINKKFPVISRINVIKGRPDDPIVEVDIKASERAIIHYTLDGSIPDRSSSRYTERFRIHEKDTYPDGVLLLNAIAFGPYGEKSELKQREISFLYETPRLPDLKTDAREKTNFPVTIRIGDDDQIVYELSAHGSEPPDPSRESEKAYNDLVFTVPRGMERTYIVKCASAGKNYFTISPPVRFEFTIDRMPPPNPVARGIPESGYSRETVTLSFEETGWPIYFQLTDDGTEPLLEGTESPLYSRPVTLYARENREITYRVHALSIDDLQNISFSTGEMRVIIDQKIPDPPGAPVVTPYGQETGKLYSISWENPGDDDIYYSLVDTENRNNGYVRFTEPIIVDFSRKTDGIILEGFKKDRAGNESRSVSYKINPAQKLMKAPTVRGVTDGGSYNKPVTFELKAGKGIIHYELTEGGKNPHGITKSSPVYNSPVTLPVADGEYKEYKLRAAVIEEDLWNPTSYELFITFTLDKKVPPPPRVRGIEDNGYYYKKMTASFYHAEDTIYYELIPAHKYSSILVPQEFMAYNKEIILDTAPGSIQHFILVAFAVDRAGNISNQQPEWHICIDKNSIFVSPSGRDIYNGTRNYPLATINKALDYSRTSRRKLITLARGVYKLKKSMTIQTDLEITGGFDPETWEPGSGHDDTSSIDSSDHYISRGYPFVQEGGRLCFRNVEFRDTHTLFSGFVKTTGGTLEMRDTTIVMENRSATSSLFSQDGEIEIFDSSFQCPASEKGSFLYVDNSDIFLSSSDFTGPATGREFTALTIKNSRECSIQKVSVFPGEADITRGVDIEDSFVLFSDSTINTGKGKQNAVGMKVKNSVVNFQTGILNCHYKAQYAIGISSINSKLTLDSTVMNVSGGTGATGLRVKDGLINMFLCTVKSSPTPDFLYLFDLENEKGSFVGNLITGADTGDTVCGILTNSETYWINNTIISGTGSANTSAFIINGDISPHFINNIIARQGKPEGTAFHFIGDAHVSSLLYNNNLPGWKNLLKLDYIKGRTGSFTYTSSQVLYKTTPDALNLFDGDALEGNIRDNFEEDLSHTFRDLAHRNFHLAPTSACINSGMDVRKFIFSGIVMDFDGEKRPAGDREDMIPLFDVGADEYYE